MEKRASEAVVLMTSTEVYWGDFEALLGQVEASQLLLRSAE
jgi:hypothetical protein